MAKNTPTQNKTGTARWDPAWLAANLNGAAKPAAAPTPTGPPAPVKPVAVDPFWTADDIDAINQFGTDLQTKLTQIDKDLTDQETDTTFQKTQTDSGAKTASSATQDDAISRGIFASSIKDASLYDIEAQRSLSQKFLDDKLTANRLNAGTNKQILGTAKEKFDTNMATRKTQNAQGVNDANSSAWATAQAAWAEANPQLANPAPAAAPPVPAAAKPAAKPTSNTLFAPTPTNSGTAKPSATRPNVATGSGSIKPKTKTTHVVYGNTP